MTDQISLITIGKIVRPHGFSREGVSHFKVQFDFAGHETLPTLKSVWIADGKGHREVALAGPVAPLGGKWSQATGAKVPFFDKDIATFKDGIQGRILAVPRSSFAPLNDSEVYLCDLLGAEVQDTEKTLYGRIEGAIALGKDSWNLQAKTPSGKLFEFPMKWIDWTLSNTEASSLKRFVVVPEVSIWVEVEKLEGERDDD